MSACGGRADHVLRKIITLLFFGNHGLLRASRLEQRDVRVVTNVEVGCDGRDGCARRAQWLRTAKSCGPGLSTLRSSPWTLLDGTRGRWGQERRSPGRARRTPLTPSRGEGRVCPAVPVVPAACILLSRRATGLSRGPAFLAPSHDQEGHDEPITSGLVGRGNARARLHDCSCRQPNPRCRPGQARTARRSGTHNPRAQTGIQYAAASRRIMAAGGMLVRPPARAMTAVMVCLQGGRHSHGREVPQPAAICRLARRNSELDRKINTYQRLVTVIRLSSNLYKSHTEAP